MKLFFRSTNSSRPKASLDINRIGTGGNFSQKRFNTAFNRYVKQNKSRLSSLSASDLKKVKGYISKELRGSSIGTSKLGIRAERRINKEIRIEMKRGNMSLTDKKNSKANIG